MEFDPTTEENNPRADRNDNDGTSETQPFIPPPEDPRTSNSGKQHEMRRLDLEQSRLDDTTPLLPQNREEAWDTLKRLFPNASAIELEAYYDPKSKRLMIKRAGAGKKAYPLYTEKRGTKTVSFNEHLTGEIRSALGPSAEQ